MQRVLSLIFIVILFSCSAQKELYVDNPQILSFGSGGGFTNQSIEYRLHSDGKLWKFKGLENDSSLLKQIKKGDTRNIFNEAYKLGLDTLKFSNPGNMSYYIHIKSKTLDNKILWSNGNNQMQYEIIEFYKTLINYTLPK